MRVATPPIEEEYATPSMSAMPKLYRPVDPGPSTGRSMVPTARAGASIIAAVEVLLIHMETNAVPAMKPRSTRLGEASMVATIERAMRLCRPHFSSAFARKNPPMKRKMTSFA